MKNISPKLLSIFCLLIATCSIQAGAALAKGLFPLVGPMGATALRAFFAAVIMLALMRPWRIRFESNTFPSILFYSLGLGGMNLLFYLSIHRIPLGIAVALEFTAPLLLTVFSSRRVIDFLWLALAMLGLCLLLPLHRIVEPLDPLGVIYALGAAFFWMLYIIFGQKVGARYGTQGAALGIAIAALFVAPFGVAQAGLSLFSLSILPLAVGVAILSTALPYTLEIIALSRLPTQTFGLLMSLEPVAAALSGLIFLSEKLILLQWLAIALIVAASIGTTLTSRARK